jgi:hypothetical protein
MMSREYSRESSLDNAFKTFWSLSSNRSFIIARSTQKVDGGIFGV